MGISASFILLAAILLVTYLSRAPQNDIYTVQSTKLSTLEDSVQEIRYESIIPFYDFPSLIEDSSLVIKARVSDISDAFKIRWVSGGTSHAMDVTVDVLTVFRGQASDTVTIRIDGGLVGDVYEDYEPELYLGNTYLFFLYQPNVGGGLNTEGDYYYATGSSQGIFQQLDDSASVSNDILKSMQKDNLFINSSISVHNDVQISRYQLAKQDTFLQEGSSTGTAILSESVFSKSIAAANKVYRINPKRVEEELLDNYNGNLQRGFITQEEYDIVVAQMDEYAIIVDDDYREPANPEAEKEKERLRAVLEQEE